MILTLRNILAAVLAGDFLLLFILAALLLLLNRSRARKTPPSREIREDLNPPREVREDLEAWRRLQDYNAGDAYGTGGGG